MLPTWSWDRISSVIFDVDGTLYDQRPIRIRMAIELFGDALSNRSSETVRVLNIFRRLREEMAERETPDFLPHLVKATAERCRVSEIRVEEIVQDWIHVRPLPLLAKARIAGLPEVLGGLRQLGKIISIWSDYPADDKLQALGVSADHVISAEDPDVGLLKPNARGIELLIGRTGVPAAATLVIGDRVEREGVAARRVGAHALIRGRQTPGWTTFQTYHDPLFSTLTGKR